MAALKQNWRWVVPLSLIAGATGVYSEVLALPGSDSRGSFRGQHLRVHWTPQASVDQDWGSADLWVQEDMQLPFIEQDNVFRGQRSDVLALNISSANWNTHTLSRTTAFAPIEDGSLVLSKDLTAGAVEATIPATVESFSNGTWTRTGVPVNVAFFLENKHPIRHERQDTWSQNPFQDQAHHWITRGRMAMRSSGVGVISIADGTAKTILIGENTPTTSWASMGNLEAGNLTFSHWDILTPPPPPPPRVE